MGSRREGKLRAGCGIIGDVGDDKKRIRRGHPRIRVPPQCPAPASSDNFSCPPIVTASVFGDDDGILECVGRVSVSIHSTLIICILWEKHVHRSELLMHHSVNNTRKQNSTLTYLTSSGLESNVGIIRVRLILMLPHIKDP